MMRVKQIGELPYWVREDGEIINGKGNAMKGAVKKEGYKEICLTLSKGVHKYFLVHRLVADAFCEKPEGASEVNHKNGNKCDNAASNLEWVTRDENLRHAYETHLMPNCTASRGIISTDIKTGEVRQYKSIHSAAKETGVSRGNICMCCQGKRPYASGREWKYA